MGRAECPHFGSPGGTVGLACAAHNLSRGPEREQRRNRDGCAGSCPIVQAEPTRRVEGRMGRTDPEFILRSVPLGIGAPRILPRWAGGESIFAAPALAHRSGRRTTSSPRRPAESLMLFRVLPQRAIENAHRAMVSIREATAGLRVLPPERESIGGRLVDSQRPERSHVEDRIGLAMAEVKDDGCGGPVNSLEQREHFDAESLVWCGESGRGDRRDERFRVLLDVRPAARGLPAAEVKEVRPPEVALPLGALRDDALDTLVGRIAKAGGPSLDLGSRKAKSKCSAIHRRLPPEDSQAAGAPARMSHSFICGLPTTPACWKRTSLPLSTTKFGMLWTPNSAAI